MNRAPVKWFFGVKTARKRDMPKAKLLPISTTITSLVSFITQPSET